MPSSTILSLGSSQIIPMSTQKMQVRALPSPSHISPLTLSQVLFIKTWFIDSETRMNPNLKYAQMNRGPAGQFGSHTGILFVSHSSFYPVIHLTILSLQSDLKCMAKIVNSILLLRKANSTAWTEEIDSQMVAWTTTYIQWLETWPTAIRESQAPK